MLQQILKDMYIDPDVLEALNEEQKKILFFKMREEQVRRWTEREEKLEREGGAALKPRRNKAHSKSVSWQLGHDGDVLVDVISDAEEVSAKQFILSKLGHKKGSSLKNDTRNQSNATRSSLVNGACSEPAKTPSQTSPGIQLQFKGVKSATGSNQQPLNSQDVQPASHSTWKPPEHQKSEDLNSGTRLPPLQNSEHLKSKTQLPPLQDPEEEEEEKDFTLYYRSHLSHDSSTPSIADRLRPPNTPHSPDTPRPLDTPRSLDTPRPPDTPRSLDTLREDLDTSADRLRLLLAQDEQAQGDNVGKPRRAGTVVRGRVAMLRQAFNSPTPPQGTLSRPKKPPLPSKPSHLLFASPTHR